MSWLSTEIFKCNVRGMGSMCGTTTNISTGRRRDGYLHLGCPALRRGTDINVLASEVARLRRRPNRAGDRGNALVVHRNHKRRRMESRLELGFSELVSSHPLVASIHQKHQDEAHQHGNHDGDGHNNHGRIGIGSKTPVNKVYPVNDRRRRRNVSNLVIWRQRG